MSKIILITGASTGIGAATAKLLAPQNKIIVHYNSSAEAAEKVAESVQGLGGEAELVQADLSTESGCVKVYEFAAEKFGKLDVLVNNAGSLIKRHPVREIEWELMEKIFALNVLSVIKLSSLCLPLLEKGTDPNIVNITSVAMRHGAPTATVYGAAKSAIDSFTRGLAKEAAPGIRINAVAPGVIETPFHERFSTPERMEQFQDATPLQRNGKPEAIALSIRHLIENSFITGETIDVNGGIFMR